MENEPPPQRALTDRMKLFARHYADCLHATNAAKLAGYSEKTAYAMGSELKRDPRVKAEINRIFDERGRSAREVKARIDDIAFGDMGDFLTVEGDEDGQIVATNLGKAKERNKLHLIRKFKQVTRSMGDAGDVTTTEFELLDPLKALGMLARHHGILGSDANDSPEDDGDENEGVPITDEQIRLEATL